MPLGTEVRNWLEAHGIDFSYQDEWEQKVEVQEAKEREQENEINEILSSGGIVPIYEQFLTANVNMDDLQNATSSLRALQILRIHLNQLEDIILPHLYTAQPDELSAASTRLFGSNRIAKEHFGLTASNRSCPRYPKS